jgi:processive 1,2-diacylglycerol beta-glucosyltransferase
VSLVAKPRILVTYVTAGTGHRRAAEALAQAIAAAAPEADVQCLEFLTFAPRWFRQGYGWSYLFLVRHASWVWKFSYHAVDGQALYRGLQPLRRAWNCLMTRRFRAWVVAHPPALIVTTHFLPADVCGAAKRAGWLKAALVVVVTDLHPHRFWLTPECEMMIVATPQSLLVAGERGMSHHRLRQLGIPVAAAFGSAIDVLDWRQRLKLEAQRRTVLVTSGGTTVGQFEQVVEALLALEGPRPGQLQLLVVCGEDEIIRRRLEQRALQSPMPMRVFGFIDTMAECMALSDLVVSKAGGLTVSEALACSKPLVLYHIIPGQERMNAQYVAAHGAGVIAHTPAAVAQAVEYCLIDPSRLHRMQAQAKALGRPQAAADIAREVILPLLAKLPSAQTR